MKLMELESIIFKSSSESMRRQGKKAFNMGFVTKIKGKKINNMYHIYGEIKNDTKSKELNTYITIDLSKGKLDCIKCTCDDFKEVSVVGHSFMCNHLTATAYSFLSKATKGNDKQVEKDENINYKNTDKNDLGNIIKLVRKVEKESIYYEAQYQIGMKKTKIDSEIGRAHV